MRRIIEKVGEFSQRSKKRSFEWIWTWTQIGEELRERRHDMNYENVVKVLRGSPLHQLALPATGGTQTSKTPKQKVPKKAATATAAQPAVPGPLEAAQPAKTKVPCALHAAGYCRFGERCRNHHVGDQVQRHGGSKSVTTRKARIRGGETSKGAGKQSRKGKQSSKGKNKGEGKGKKGDNKGTKGSTGTPAAVSAAASTVTISKVEGKQAQKAWQSFCQFCNKAFPILSFFEQVLEVVRSHLSYSDFIHHQLL